MSNSELMTPVAATATPLPARAAPGSATRVFLFTDLVGSTAWKQLLGDRGYAAAVRRPHDLLFRELLAGVPGAVERDNAGDGFLATFANPSDAVHFALRLHRALAGHSWDDNVRAADALPAVRVGIHLGEVVEHDDGLGSSKVTGQAVDLAARIMGLAIGRQTLLTRHAGDSARQHVRGDSLAAGTAIAWLFHGRYRFKGLEAEPIEIFEVGEEGLAPLAPPPDGDKARRVTIDPEDETGAWRPAAGLTIPRRDGWVIESKLGEGGFGEVWLAHHKRTKEHRVFKFCFDAERLRSFKRELTFFRLIQRELGSRPDFARLYDVEVERPPYFLESEYVGEGNLGQWVEKHGGMSNWPLASRLKFLAGVAGAVAAAHSLGIIHKDLKPSNVFVFMEGGAPRPVLADFGIGVLADSTLLQRDQITETGFTESEMLANDSSRTGTRLYSPPESMLGMTATTGTDIYALGVMLFQFVAGDLHRPLGTGWQEAIDGGDADRTALLIEDITAATYLDPARRLGSAAELAQRLSKLDERVAERHKQAARTRLTRRLKVVQKLLGAALVGLGLVGVLAVYAWKQRAAAEAALVAEKQALRDKDQALAAESAALKEKEQALRDVTSARDAERRERDRALAALRDKDMALAAETAALKEKDQALRAVTSARDAERQARDRALAALRDLTDDVVENQLARAASLTEENKEFLRKIIKHFEDLASITAADVESRAIRAEGSFRVATMRSGLGELKEAEAAFADALRIYKQLTAELPTRADFRQDMARALNNLANLYRTTGRFNDAQVAYTDARTIRQKLVTDFPTRPEFRRQLARSHHNLGALLNDTGHPKEAETAYNEALAISKQLAAEFPNRPEFRQDLATSHNNLGNLLLATGRQKLAEVAFNDALIVRKQLAADFSARPEFRQDLATSQSNLGILFRVTGRTNEARTVFGEALAVRQRLAADFPARPEFRQELAASHINMGLLHHATGRLQDAETACTEALAIQKRLAADFPTRPEFSQDLARTHNYLGNLFIATRRLKDAETAYSDSRAIFVRLAADFPTRPEFRRELAGSHNNLGNVLRATGRLPAAQTAYTEALKVQKRLAADFPNQPELHNDLAGTLGNLAILANQRGDFGAAKAYLDEAAPHHQAALKSNPRHPAYRQFYHTSLLAQITTTAGLLDESAAVRAAETVRDLGWNPSGDAYDAACALALCVSVVKEHAGLDAAKRQAAVQTYADRALAMLRVAVAKGFTNVAHMKKDPDLDPLRGRDDFKKLLADLAAKVESSSAKPPPK